MLQLLRDLKNLKEQEGISTDTIAEQSGISRATIVRLWAGDSDPRLQTVVDVAAVLKAKLILSTERSRQAFIENDVRPFRELLAEKEKTIAVKDEVIRGKEESIQRYEHHIQVIQQREEAHRNAAYEHQRRATRIAVALGVILFIILVLFAVDSKLPQVGWIQY